nr:hypothetical protein [Sorangium cellulosum]
MLLPEPGRRHEVGEPDRPARLVDKEALRLDVFVRHPVAVHRGERVRHARGLREEPLQIERRAQEEPVERREILVLEDEDGRLAAELHQRGLQHPLRVERPGDFKLVEQRARRQSSRVTR